MAAENEVKEFQELQKLNALDAKVIEQIQEFCRLGARIPMLKSLYPLVHEKVLSNYFYSENLRYSPKGGSAIEPKWFLKKIGRRLFASVVGKCYLDLLSCGATRNEAILKAIILYRTRTQNFEIREDDWMNCERLNLLCRCLDSGQMKMVKCGICGYYYVQSVNEMFNDQANCPVHKRYPHLCSKSDVLFIQESKLSNTLAQHFDLSADNEHIHFDHYEE